MSRLQLDDCVRSSDGPSYQDRPRFLVESDAGAANSCHSDLGRYASPIKIFEHMAAGLPVIGADIGETRCIIEDEGSGVAVEFSPENFAQAVLGLLGDPAHYGIHSARAIEFAVRHGWARLLDGEMDFIGQVQSRECGGH